MKKEELINVLEDVGLSENESKVYLALISLGPSNATEISKKSGVKRTTVYPLIESLKKKGLVVIEMKVFKQLYKAEGPEKLENIIELRKERFKKYLPEFSSLYSSKEEESVIGYLEGEDAIRNAYYDLLKDLKEGDEYLVISQGKKVFDQLGMDWFEKFIQDRASYKPDVKVLYANVPWAAEHKKLERQHKITVKVLPKDTDFQANLIITPNHTLVHKLDDPMIGIIIGNKSAIQVFQQMFNIMWDSVKE